jgi:hypothetical protein
MNKPIVSVRLHPDDIAAVARFAKSKNIRPSDIIREAVAEKLVKMDRRERAEKKVAISAVSA